MTHQTKETDLAFLETLLDPDFVHRRTWQPQELGAMLEHQWDSLFKADMAGLDPAAAGMLTSLCEAQSLSLKSYGDILSHKLPPIELLEIIQDYAKRNLARPGAAIPGEIAELLYVLSIVVARVRWGRRITTQNDSTVLKNIRTLLAHTWLTPPVSELLREGVRVFGETDGADKEENERHAG